MAARQEDSPTDALSKAARNDDPGRAAAQFVPRFLFLPVSGEYGMGEYARSLEIARGAAARWPGALIHFALSRAAPYAANTPFPYTLLPSSPTFHTPEVIGLLEKFQPHVVIFDNAGRTAQLSAAKRTGVRVVYVSARARQRRKAFRWRWMSLIDEHWIAYPEFLAGSLTSLQRLKLHLRGHPTVRYLDVILPDSDPRANASMLDRIGLAAESFALFVPGGGTGHPGVRDEVSVFYAAARDLAARGTPAVLVAPTFNSTAALPSALRTLPRLPLAELAQLMRQARLVVANGGSTLVQAIGCGAACIAVAIAGDQAERIRHCTDAGLALAAPLEANAIVALATQLMGDAHLRSALAQRAADLKLADGLTVALDALDALIRGCSVA